MATLYVVCYWVHITCVTLSGSFFLVRGIWMLQDNVLLQHKFVRIAPHVNDTILLTAAVGLAVITQQYPITHNWLTIKLVLLLAYIGLGVVALRGATRTRRITAFVAALACFAAMVGTALFVR